MEKRCLILFFVCFYFCPWLSNREGILAYWKIIFLETIFCALQMQYVDAIPVLFVGKSGMHYETWVCFCRIVVCTSDVSMSLPVLGLAIIWKQMG